MANQRGNPVTLFTGQWADLPFVEVARLARQWGYDGLEIAAAGDHLDLEVADTDDVYVRERLDILHRHGLAVYAINNALSGQAVCDDPIDFRHQALLRPGVWGDGDAEGVRRRAAADMGRAARVARRLGADTVVGFTGSKIWQYFAQFPPVPDSVIEAGYADFAKRWNPILDVFDSEGVRFAHEVHPSEIAYDYWTSLMTLDVIERRSAFGFNWDPSHMLWQGIDPVDFLIEFADRIYHVDCKDTRMRPSTGRNGLLGSHLPWGDPRRRWDFVSTGRGDVPWEDAFRTLRAIEYRGPISIEWEDSGMDRLRGASEAIQFVRSLLWERPDGRFDAAFTDPARGQ